MLEVIPSRQENWIPIAILPFACARDPRRRWPSVSRIAIHQPRNAIAWILLLGSLQPGAQITLEVFLGDCLVAPARGASDVATPLRLADCGCVRVPERAPALTTLALGCRCGSGLCFLGFMTIAHPVDTEPFDKPHLAIPSPFADSRFCELDRRLRASSGSGYRCGSEFSPACLRAATAMILRFRRSRGIERLQVLWLAWAAALIPLGSRTSLAFCRGSVLAVADVHRLPGAPLDGSRWLWWGAIGIAMTRYRLYAIERMVNRTLVYVSLTLRWPSRTSGITLVVGVARRRRCDGSSPRGDARRAFAFRPLRARVQTASIGGSRRARYTAVRQVRGVRGRGAGKPASA